MLFRSLADGEELAVGVGAGSVELEMEPGTFYVFVQVVFADEHTRIGLLVPAVHMRVVEGRGGVDAEARVPVGVAMQILRWVAIWSKKSPRRRITADLVVLRSTGWLEGTGAQNCWQRNQEPCKSFMTRHLESCALGIEFK